MILVNDSVMVSPLTTKLLGYSLLAVLWYLQVIRSITLRYFYVFVPTC